MSALNIGEEVRTFRIEPATVPVPQKTETEPQRTRLPQRAPKRAPADPAKPRRTPAPTRVPGGAS